MYPLPKPRNGAPEFSPEQLYARHRRLFSSGIGYAVASAALANDSKVLSVEVTQLQSLYPNVHVKGSAVLDAAVNETGGPLDHIVYTSGGVTLAEITAETALQRFAVRYLGPLLVGKLVAANPGKYLKAAHTYFLDHPHLGRTSAPSPSGTLPRDRSCGAVEVLTRALAVDLAPIRVNVVIPGVLDTETYKAASLTKEIGTPEGSAEAYLFCMRSALATGQGFKIENGSSLA
ncbi:hypothetical protein C8R45DRAFT_1069252 [Mycena sanguinolenta]|nr:hypothetical protein C8R45DRAFT_1069252 [Mycena sanguinolenta]